VHYLSMPTYYFALRNRDAVAHREGGRDFPDLKTALVHAQGAARSMIHNRLQRHQPIELHGSFDVEDEQHRPRARIMLADLARQLS
jgi:hypothetical protein